MTLVEGFPAPSEDISILHIIVDALPHLPVEFSSKDMQEVIEDMGMHLETRVLTMKLQRLSQVERVTSGQDCNISGRKFCDSRWRQRA